MRPERLAWFRLSRRLGMSVFRAQLEISSKEFAEWVAFEQLEPGGEEHQELLNANLIGWLSAIMGGDTKLDPNIFRLKLRREGEEEQSEIKELPVDEHGETTIDRANRIRCRAWLGV